MNISGTHSSSTFTALPGLSSRAHGPGAAHLVTTNSAAPTTGEPARPVTSSPLSPVNEPFAAARAERDKVRADGEKGVENQRRAREEQLIQSEIKMLAARDREVRAHEQAHMAAGGQYAGAATYQYQRGPNGVNYAIGGEVPISTSKEATPEATLRKAQIIRRAALAPAEPSPQDRKVAAMAMQMESAARTEIARERKLQVDDADAESADSEPTEGQASKASSSTSPPENPQDSANQSNNDRIQRIYRLDESDRRLPGTLLSLMA